MRCRNCGSYYEPGDMYCEVCGAPLYQQQQPSRNGTAFTVIIGVVIGIAVLSMAFCGIYLLTHKSQEAEQTKPGISVGDIDIDIDPDELAEAAEKYKHVYYDDDRDVEYVYYYDPYFAESDASLYAPDAPEFFPDSSNRYLSDCEVSGLTENQRQRAINDIYARNGLIFKTQRYQDYYEIQPWYYGYTDSQEEARAQMNDYEVYNIGLLQ